MLRIYKKMTMIAVLVVIALVLAMPAAAMEFSVNADLPENQRQNGSLFFDLLVYPGQEQEIEIVISNTSDADIVVLVETIAASTNRNGQINYTSREPRDESLKFSFEDIAKIPESNYVVPAESSIRVPISLTIPNEPFEGAILGSIRVLREATQEERDAAGAIVNQFANVTAVRLVQSEAAENIPADFTLAGLSATLVNYKASIVANIRNPQPIIIKGASANAVVYPLGSEKAIFEQSIETLDFAPNSTFPLSFIDREGYGIEAGDYKAVIEIRYKGQAWNFEQDFTIEPQVAETINDGALNQTGQVRPGTEAAGMGGVPIWAVIAIAVGAAILTAIIALMIMIARRRPLGAH